MTIYVDAVMGLNFLVDLLLLVGTNRLAGYPSEPKRIIPAAALGGLYGGMCLVPGFRFLGNYFWRLVSLGLMGAVAFGFHRGIFRRVMLFVLLSMALGGIALGMGQGGFVDLILGAFGLCLLCTLGFRGKLGQTFATLELRHGGKKVTLMALRDTGNTLRDPVTGEAVLIVGAEAAQKLLGMTGQEVGCPVETMASGKYSGLRLIPYRAVGQFCGMLLGIRLDEVVLGGVRTNTLVAFTAEGLSGAGEYQALAGGAI